ncbi:histidine phosphatase family protein [Nocardioides sp. WS12]|uniref:histidine phosphatase family protein n=1 Tax=Nocardioides sp. WS12 TaxID=2486272 RepID=UPI001F17CEFF|nr:histidine phosphatase family protein [Nocardioides sp. WS12]
MRIGYLVRHGQASFGKKDYDALSDLGHLQARVLGRELAAREITPDLIIRGGLRRHRETADGILQGLEQHVPVAVDEDWDEFDFQHVMEVHKPLYRSRALMLADLARTRQPKAAFQAVFEEATARWIGGGHDEEYDESFPAFAGRVEGALERMTERGPEKGTVLVVSSGGPIGLAASLLLAGDTSLWGSLNRVAVNTGVTKVIHGRTGLNLSSYNSHTHVEHDRELLTYR